MAVKPYTTPHYPVKDEKLFFDIVRAAFQQRRKKLRNSLSKFDLNKVDFDLSKRPEQLSLDDFVVSFFTSGPGSTTLPILIYSSVKRGLTPDINALSSLIVLASLLATVCVMLLQRKPEG